MTCLEDEIFSQPASWATAIARATDAPLPRPGERVAVIGCGSSLNVARAYARLREDAGQGITDAYPASEVTGTRTYDHIVLISRTGTTSEVLAALRDAPAGVITTAITADPDAPLARETDNVVLLDFANERSVVSSQFITTAIVIARAHLGEDVAALPALAAAELARPLPDGLAGRREFTFLGAGWAAFLADEAALKQRAHGLPVVIVHPDSLGALQCSDAPSQTGLAQDDGSPPPLTLRRRPLRKQVLRRQRPAGSWSIFLLPTRRLKTAT